MGSDGCRQRGGETSRSRDGTKAHPCIQAEHLPGKHSRLYKDDVSHREKRGSTGQQFGARAGFVLRQFKQTLDHGYSS